LIGSFGFLGIGGHSLKIRLNELPDTSFICVSGDLGRGCFALSQRFFETLKRETEAGLF
jgi:archaellum biogenesis ATPase FlaH